MRAGPPHPRRGKGRRGHDPHVPSRASGRFQRAITYVLAPALRLLGWASACLLTRSGRFSPRAAPRRCGATRSEVATWRRSCRKNNIDRHGMIDIHLQPLVGSPASRHSIHQRIPGLRSPSMWVRRTKSTLCHIVRDDRNPHCSSAATRENTGTGGRTLCIAPDLALASI